MKNIDFSQVLVDATKRGEKPTIPANAMTVDMGGYIVVVRSMNHAVSVARAYRAEGWRNEMAKVFSAGSQIATIGFNHFNKAIVRLCAS